MAGTAVFRIVVSSDSIKNATATSHGKSCLLEGVGKTETEGGLMESAEPIGFAWCNQYTSCEEIMPAVAGFPQDV